MEKLCAQIFRCPEILEVIFKNSDFGRLKKCRLVCKIWNKEICRWGRENWVASLSCKKHLSLFKAMVESRQNTQLPLPFDKIDMMAQRKIPTGSYLWLSAHGLEITKLNLGDVKPNIKETRVSFESADFLLRTYSSTLTSLSLHFYPSKIQDDEPLHFPRLEDLELRYYNNSQDQLAPVISFFLKIISAAPNLRGLSMYGNPPKAEILAGADLHTLKKLGIVALGQILKESQARLQGVIDLSTFTFNWIGPEALRRHQQSLSGFTSRLKVLKIWFIWSFPSGVNPSNFLIFPHLTTLKLQLFKPGGLDFSCFPSLKEFQCNFVNWHPNVWTAGAISPSVQTVAVYLGVGTDGGSNQDCRTLAPPELQEYVFIELFTSFPKAQTWELPYGNAVSFCKAVSFWRAVSYSDFGGVKTLMLSSNARDAEDEVKLLYDDRAIFSHLECLRDLETLGLFNDCLNPQWDIHIEALDFKVMPSLQTLLFRPSYGDKVENFHSLEGGPKVIIFGPKSLDGTEELLSVPNFEFIKGDPTQYHLQCPTGDCDRY